MKRGVFWNVSFFEFCDIARLNLLYIIFFAVCKLILASGLNRIETDSQIMQEKPCFATQIAN